jgi:hypothetical protein
MRPAALGAWQTLTFSTLVWVSPSSQSPVSLPAPVNGIVTLLVAHH